MIVVSGVLTFEAQAHDRVVELARTLTAKTLKEQGCRTYQFWADPSEPGRFRIFEEWDSQEALTAHFAEPHFAAFGQAFAEGEMISMDVRRYIDPKVADLFEPLQGATVDARSRHGS